MRYRARLGLGPDGEFWPDWVGIVDQIFRPRLGLGSGALEPTLRFQIGVRTRFEGWEILEIPGPIGIGS